MQLKFNLMLHAEKKKRKPNRIFYILNNIHICNVYIRVLVFFYYPVPKAEYIEPTTT